MRTNLLLQDDINELYRGNEMSTHYVYATQYSYLICCLMYASGQPLLHWFLAIFFAGYFVVYKFLLLKSYAKSTTFNQQIPIEATRLVSYGVILHCSFGLLLFSNANLTTSKVTVKAFVDSGRDLISYILSRSTNFNLAIAFFVFAIFICAIVCIRA